MFRLVDHLVCASLVVAVVVTTAGRSSAQDRESDARIDYSAPASCPAVAELVAGVTARLPRFHVSERSARQFTVDVSMADDGFIGRLTAIDAGGVRAERDVAGDSCEEVVGALGLVLAIAIDPGAALTAPIAAADGGPAASTTSSVAARSPRGSRETREVHEVYEPAALNTSTYERDDWAAGAGFASTVGEANVRMLGGTAFVQRAISWGAWRPVLRVGATRASSDTLEVAGHGSARFTWTVGTIDLCPIRWGQGRWNLMPCVRIDSGAISGRGSNIAHPRDDSRFWMDAAAIASGEWAVAPPMFVRLEGGILVPLTRPRFHFDAPDVTVAAPSPVGAVGAFYMGGRFP